MRRRSKGTYYLGRVIKGGILDQETFIKSILNPKPVSSGKHNWTIIDSGKGRANGTDFVFGKLSKYSPDATLKFVEPEEGTEVERLEPNLSIYASPFVYIPEKSGIAYLHSSRDLPHWLFRKRFCEVIEATNDYFFTDCTIESISDLRTFASKLSQMESIEVIAATVYPSNPLFGPLWASLRSYLGNRNLRSLEVKEEAIEDTTINTELPDVVERLVGGVDAATIVGDGNVPIADAAILMAADGYGHGQVEGESQGRRIVIRTSETIKNFAFDRDPVPEELAVVALDLLYDIEQERDLRH